MNSSINKNIKPITNPVAAENVGKDVITATKVKPAQLLARNDVKSNTQSKVDSTINNSWATTISRYLLERRKQTQTAYQAQLQPSPVTTNEGSDTENWLFEAVFEILVQRLEEGHTVLVLEVVADSDTDNNFNSNADSFALSNGLQDDNANLSTWQLQLLQPLLQPLVIQAEGILAATMTTGIEILENKELWQAALLQSSLPIYEKQILEQRYVTCRQLYNFLIAGNHPQSETLNLQKNSLSKFITLLEKNPLFSKAKNNSKNIDSPITFQEEKNLQSELSVDDNLTVTIWLHRTWQAEYALARHIMRIKNQTVNKLPITLNPLLNTEQQDAIHMANNSAFSIITGGPGTGKTFTVAQLVIALQQAQAEDVIGDSVSKTNLALAAPTGKAAQRMQESLQDALQQAGVTMQLPEAKTIHRLLGIGRGGQPRYNADNPLSEDIVIVDEASMLGVELANYLVSAIKPNARLILLGDANQLAAVDAGAVLADLCRIPALQDVHQRLEVSRRFSAESGIGKLARLINQNDTDLPAVWELLRDDEALSFYQAFNTASDIPSTSNKLTLNSLSDYNRYFERTKKILKKTTKEKSIPALEHIKNYKELMISLNTFKVLTAGHYGQHGDHYINNYLSEQHKNQLKLPLSKSPWYHGRPVMILQNNYELGLFNGDIGICLQTDRGRLQVFFENKAQGISVNMLSDETTATAYAMTIHKSQGSEFEHIAISFDDQNTRLLSKELIYTAVTRAKKRVSIFSTASAFTYALSTPTVRQTGLALQFSKFN
ncbi:exodeoxyribonuclease V subunit alpha [Psychrobacter frigidicola]|uniref:RecBCD enzyme subunit RecD n=1 Tax=Psychrobacter frigidicola TaxID=45611 RepID=A0A5C7A341_9GAMM|nr:exodeoxyribonuclease V subunit alpha [Psychrobacter frigidicola]TXD97809.1 exodeoxyribonuclease V subunit alpha [Psychrobacter frigidicola]